MIPLTLGKVVLIEDSITVSARNIVGYTLTNTTDAVKVLCLERSSEQWKKTFYNKNYGYYTDVDELINSLTEDMSVLIDSINLMAALTNWESTLSQIHRLIKINSIKRLVLIVHSDCLIYGPIMIKSLKYLCQTHIIIKEKDVVDIYNSSPSGKITKSTCSLYFDSKQTWQCVEVKSQPAAQISNPNKDRVHNIASFKISVDKTAEKIKNELVLPYTEKIGMDSSLILKPDFDDWDEDYEDDPDDDLNI